jgi:hypothetical protein
MKEPLAICRLGNIYNYENVLEALAKKELPAKYGYIRKLKDIKKVGIVRVRSSSIAPQPIVKTTSPVPFRNWSTMASINLWPIGSAGISFPARL